MIELNELQLSLLILGTFVILGVWLFNRLQLRRARKGKSTQDTPFMMQRREPVLRSTFEPSFYPQDEIERAEEDDTLPLQSDELPLATLVDEVIAVEAENDKSDTALISPAKTYLSIEPVIDSLIDCVVDLPLEHSISSERILPLLTHLRHAGTKPIYCEGLNLDAQKRETICAGQRYRDICVAVQLADRSGVITTVELSEFISGVQQLAQHLESHVVLPELANMLAKAKNIDSFAQQNDMQIYIHIESTKQPWLASNLRLIMEQQGLILSRDGTYFIYMHPEHSAAASIFTVHFENTCFLQSDLSTAKEKKISLRFDAPCVAEGVQAFRQMWSYATQFAQLLDGVMVDDLGKPLHDNARTLIERHLCELYARLSTHHMPAGTTTTLRLFSRCA